MNPVQVVDGRIMFNGESVVILGRFSGKFLPYLKHGGKDKCLQWIEHNQALGVNLLEVPYEEMLPRVGYENPPHYKPLPLRQMLHGNRVKAEQIDIAVLRGLYQISHNTGMAFALVIDMTLKHIAGLTSGMIGHVISRVVDWCRSFAEEYPKAKIIFNFHYGFDIGVVPINQDKGALKQQAKRVRRWRHEDDWSGKNIPVRYTFTSPGPKWHPEQYPDAVIMVSAFSGISYPTGDGVDEYPITAVLTPGTNSVNIKQLKTRQCPVWVSGVDAVIEDVEWAQQNDVNFIITDSKGLLMDVAAPFTSLEKQLLGDEPPPPPPPPSEWDEMFVIPLGVWEYQLRRRKM